LIAGGEDVRAVRVPGDLIGTCIVASHQSERRDVILGPYADGSVPATGCEVVAEGTPFNIPDRTFMAFVDDKASPCLEGPEPNCLVGRAGDEKPRGCRGSRCVSIFRAFDGGREGNAIDGCGMSDEATRAGWRIILGGSDKRGKRVAV
jgi:hypothetical protein